MREVGKEGGREKRKVGMDGWISFSLAIFSVYSLFLVGYVSLSVFFLFCTCNLASLGFLPCSTF